MKDVNFLKARNVDVDKALELFGDMDTYNETIKEFQSSLPEKVDFIKKYFEEKDMPNYAIYVHSLKSDCKYFGFMDLAQLAYDHELKSKANDFAYVSEHYEELMNKTNEIKTLVDEYLSDDVVAPVEPVQPVEVMEEVPAAPVTPSAINMAAEASSTPMVDNDVKYIMVADDSEVIRLFVKKIFNGEYEILSAKDGEEALNLLKQYSANNIKALLLDLNMPKVDGFAVLDYLKDNNLFNTIPTTVISGDSSSDAINKAFTYPIVDMLNKPFSEDKIKQAVLKTISFGS
jgi:CheY-like chemotaxis protein/HPt (histidine-containing phosphotransfer) domain-containing protein